MLCEDCGKKKATCQYTEIQSLESKNKKTVHNLCKECAEKRSGGGVLMSASLDIGHFLAEIVQEGSDEGDISKGMACPYCDCTYREFGEEGWLGCSDCYTAFESEISVLLKKIHSGVVHTGKVPKRAETSSSGALPPAKERPRIPDPQRRISELEKELSTAVSDENFERAARLRDQIATLKGNMGSTA